jgi:ActR/RegA family two-component response regulator
MARGPERIALIVDDDRLLCRSVARALKPYFTEVMSATTPAAADEILGRHPITHLISDCVLGDDLPLGVELIPGWRRRCPTIRRAVVFTGSDLSGIYIPTEVDEVVEKLEGSDKLLEALGIAP